MQLLVESSMSLVLKNYFGDMGSTACSWEAHLDVQFSNTFPIAGGVSGENKTNLELQIVPILWFICVDL